MPTNRDIGGPSDTAQAEAILIAALKRTDRTPNERAAKAARQVFELFRGAKLVPQKTAISRNGSVVFTFQSDRRFAIYECDADGEVVLTLTDRSSEDDPRVCVMAPAAVISSFGRTQQFLG